MKKILALGLVIVMMVALAACGGDKPNETTPADVAEVITPDNEADAPPVTEGEPFVEPENETQELAYKEAFTFEAEGFTLAQSDEGGAVFSDGATTVISIRSTPVDTDDEEVLDVGNSIIIESVFENGTLVANNPWDNGFVKGRIFAGMPASADMIYSGATFAANGETHLFLIGYKAADAENAISAEDSKAIIDSIKPI